MVVLVFALFMGNYLPGKHVEKETTTEEILLLASEYRGSPFIEVNGNVPYFKEKEYTTEPFETYSELDSLGRCGVAYANIGKDLMPTEERGEIGMIKPSGWHTVKYPEVIEDLFL